MTMPRPVQPKAYLKNWYFNQQHKMCGYIYADQRENPCLDGDYQEIMFIQHVVEYEDEFLVRTSSGIYWGLKKAEENIHRQERNKISIEGYKNGFPMG